MHSLLRLLFWKVESYKGPAHGYATWATGPSTLPYVSQEQYHGLQVCHGLTCTLSSDTQISLTCSIFTHGNSYSYKVCRVWQCWALPHSSSSNGQMALCCYDATMMHRR